MTTRDVLDTPEVQRGHPVVLVGHDLLDREVTWVHVLEGGEVSGTLRGGELVLLTGIALPDSNDGLRKWIADLKSMRVSAIMIQLGPRWVKLPSSLVRAAEDAAVPIIGLNTKVPFVDITRAVLTTIVHSTFWEMQQSAEVYELFHRIALEGRNDSEIVHAVSWLTRSFVVLENRSHQALFSNNPIVEHDSEALLRDWERRSRRDGADENWLISDVEVRGQTWGRMIAVLDRQAVATRLQRLAVERGAKNIALRRVVEGDDAVFELEARSELLNQLVRRRYRHESEGKLQAEAAGFPVTGRALIGLALRAPGAQPEEVRSCATRMAAAARLDLLIGLDGGALLSLPPERDPTEVLQSWVDRVRTEYPSAIVGVGHPVTTLWGVRGSMLSAFSAARAEASRGSMSPVVRLKDVRVRGLLAEIAQDPKLQDFIERELGPLLDPSRATELEALRAYLAEGRNKAAAASAVHLSRPAFYARLGRAASLLSMDLDDTEACLSLHLAILGHDVISVWPFGGPLAQTTSLPLDETPVG